MRLKINNITMKKLLCLLSLIIFLTLNNAYGASHFEGGISAEGRGASSRIVDKNTGVVYLGYMGYYRYAITVMLNTDGTPVTAEQLGINY